MRAARLQVHPKLPRPRQAVCHGMLQGSRCFSSVHFCMCWCAFGSRSQINTVHDDDTTEAVTSTTSSAYPGNAEAHQRVSSSTQPHNPPASKLSLADISVVHANRRALHIKREERLDALTASHLPTPPPTSNDGSRSEGSDRGGELATRQDQAHPFQPHLPSPAPPAPVKVESTDDDNDAVNRPENKQSGDERLRQLSLRVKKMHTKYGIAAGSSEKPAEGRSPPFINDMVSMSKPTKPFSLHNFSKPGPKPWQGWRSETKKEAPTPCRDRWTYSQRGHSAIPLQHDTASSFPQLSIPDIKEEATENDDDVLHGSQTPVSLK